MYTMYEQHFVGFGEHTHVWAVMLLYLEYELNGRPSYNVDLVVGVDSQLFKRRERHFHPAYS